MCLQLRALGHAPALAIYGITISLSIIAGEKDLRGYGTVGPREGYGLGRGGGGPRGADSAGARLGGGARVRRVSRVYCVAARGGKRRRSRLRDTRHAHIHTVPNLD